MRSPSPSIRRSTAPLSVFSDRSSCQTRKKSSLYPTNSATRADDRRLVMASQQGMIRTTIALGIALTLAAPLTASAQGAGGGEQPAAPAQGAGGGAGAQAGGGGQGGGRGRGGPPPYTPAADARDLRSVLHNWGWHLGMLRSDQERDIVASLEYQGKGTMQVGGQPCNVTKYRSSINYQTSGERIQITGTRPNGQSCSTIEVLSGAYAWN